MISPERLELAEKYDVPPLDDMTYVSCPPSKMALLDNDGNAYVWGWNPYGSVGDGTNISRQLPYKLPLENIRLLRVSNYSSFAVTQDGSLYVWGSNTSGMIGLGADQCLQTIDYHNYPINHYTPEKVKFDGDIVDIVNRGWYTAILTSDGEVYSCGAHMEKISNSFDVAFGEDEPDYPCERTFEFTKIELPEKMVSVSCDGANYVFASASGKIYVLGLVGDTNGKDYYNELTELQFPEPIAKVHAYFGTIFAISENGTLYGYGSNANGALCLDDLNSFEREPVKILENVSDIEGFRSFVAVTNSGECYGWGQNYCNIFQVSGEEVRDLDLSVISPIETKPVMLPLPEKIVCCDIDDGRCVALSESGKVYFWGKDSFNYSLSPQFTCESVRDIPFSAREIISEPSVIGS